VWTFSRRWAPDLWARICAPRTGRLSAFVCWRPLLLLLLARSLARLLVVWPAAVIAAARDASCCGLAASSRRRREQAGRQKPARARAELLATPTLGRPTLQDQAEPPGTLWLASGAGSTGPAYLSGVEPGWPNLIRGRFLILSRSLVLFAKTNECATSSAEANQIGLRASRLFAPPIARPRRPNSGS